MPCGIGWLNKFFKGYIINASLEYKQLYKVCTYTCSGLNSALIVLYNVGLVWLVFILHHFYFTLDKRGTVRLSILHFAIA